MSAADIVKMMVKECVMNRLFAFFFTCAVLALGCCQANTVVWNGEVNASGAPSDSVPLVLGKKYMIKVSGIVNLGKWWQQGKPLAEDACYEFNAPSGPTHYRTFKNSLRVSVCDGKYHDDHTYQSEPFVAAQS
jgi:hypothetical protein